MIWLRLHTTATRRNVACVIIFYLVPHVLLICILSFKLIKFSSIMSQNSSLFDWSASFKALINTILYWRMLISSLMIHLSELCVIFMVEECWRTDLWGLDVNAGRTSSIMFPVLFLTKSSTFNALKANAFLFYRWLGSQNSNQRVMLRCDGLIRNDRLL